MNLPTDHPLKEAELAKLNNPLGDAGEPVFPFVYKAKVPTNQKIQVEDQRLTATGIPLGDRVKRSIQMPYFGLNDVVVLLYLLALKHAYEFFQHVCGITFYDAKKRGELFAATLKGTVALRWEHVVTTMINVTTFEDSLDYFQTCLQLWTKSYFSQDSRAKHFTFMRAKGSIFKHRDLRIDEYAFWEAIYLYNEMGNFLWHDPANPVEKLSENELKLTFFNGQPKPWHLQFLEAPGAPWPDDCRAAEGTFQDERG